MRQESVNTVVNWLAQPNNGPRRCECVFDFFDNQFYEQLLTAIRQQFLAAKTPSIFSLILDQSAEFHLENNIGEVLHGTHIEFDGLFPILQITRHPAKCNTQEMREWIEKVCKKRRGRIQVYNPTTVGPFDAAQLGVPSVDGEEQAEQQQPCSSKDVY